MAKKAVKKSPKKKSQALTTTNVATLPANPRNMLALIARAAADPKVDVGKMQALLDMQRQVMADQAKIEFDADYIAMQEQLPSIAQDGKIIITEKNDKTKVIQSTKYATYNNINKIIRPVLQRFGFALTFQTEAAADGRLNVKGILKHKGGHQETTTFPLPLDTSGSKNNVQGAGSSLSYGKRYSAIALLNLVTHALEDHDTDGHVVQRFDTTQDNKDVVIEAKVVEETKVAVITKAQASKLADAIQDCGVSEKRFLEKYNIKLLEELPASLFDAATTACRNYKSATQPLQQANRA